MKVKNTGIKVESKFGEKTRVFLLENELLNTRLRPVRNTDFLIFGIKNSPNEIQTDKLKNITKIFEFTETEFEELEKKPSSLKNAIKGVLNEKELSELISSFDLIGNIAILEVPKSLSSKEKMIGKALMKSNPQVKTVAKITDSHKGQFRIRPVKVIAGENNLIAEYKEHGCTLYVELGAVFFSPRLSHERDRISKLIKNKENVGVFFAGVGPFALVFAKNSNAKKITGIELNPRAIELFKENILKNKVQDRVEAVLMDVNNAPEFYSEEFDRIAMPLPRGGHKFLLPTVKCLKRSGIIHFYRLVDRETMFDGPIGELEEVAYKLNKTVKVLDKRIVRSFSPTKQQVVIDAMLC